MASTVACVSDATITATAIPQTKPLHPTQVPNSAGGFCWQVQPLDRLRRFLCLGVEGGTYYATEKQLALENVGSIHAILKDDEGALGPQVVAEVVDFSVNGRTAKQGALLFTLALCAKLGDQKTRQLAYAALPKVCRIPTHLFTFVEYAEALSVGTGWGKAHRKAIASWYNSKDAKHLAFQCTKYRTRNGWSHRDLLRLAHPKPCDHDHDVLYKYIAKGLEAVTADDKATMQDQELMAFLVDVEMAKSSTSADDTIAAMTRHHLAREHVATGLLGNVEIWRHLLANMGLTAMIRNLGKMTSVGLLTRDSAESAVVVGRLQDEAALHKARVHPFNVLLALKTYSRGQGDKGSLEWDPVPAVVDALERAYYKSFASVKPTGKRFVLAIDVSGSMTCGTVCGGAITPREAAAAMAMVTLRTEAHCHTLGFTTHLVPLDMRPTSTLTQVCTAMDNVQFGKTDCAAPMVHCQRHNVQADVFIVFTDNETYHGDVHPSQALRNYRAHTGIPAKLIVVGIMSNGFTIADPADKGMLDICGFDANVPALIENFVGGQF